MAARDAEDHYFAMARGADGIAPLEVTKWFDTNYHYLVPELGPGTRLRLDGDKPIAEYSEAREIGVETRPVLIGPLSFLLLSKPDTPGFGTLDHGRRRPPCPRGPLVPPGRPEAVGYSWLHATVRTLPAPPAPEWSPIRRSCNRS